MNPELRNRLLRLDLDRVTYALDPAQAVFLACDLLVAGFDSPALCDLAGESPTRLEANDADWLIRRMLVELGLKPMTFEEAEQLLDGG
jgi:hypothetical protein